MPGLETPVVVQVFRQHAQQEVAVARHEVALDDVRQLPDRGDEGVDRLLVLTVSKTRAKAVMPKPILAESRSAT